MSIGSRHIFEDLIALVLGRVLQPDRALLVATELAKFFQDAEEGWKILQGKSIFLRPPQREQFSAYCSLNDCWRDKAIDRIRILAKCLDQYCDAFNQGKPVQLSFESDAVRDDIAGALRGLIVHGHRPRGVFSDDDDDVLPSCRQ